jgi:hypothetical protein
LKPIFTPAERPGGAVVACDAVAFAGVRAAPDEVRHLRQNLILPSGERLPAGFLKQAEDQTLVALAAVSDAMLRHGLTEASFSSWGVLGAPRFLGRVAMVAAIEKMRVEGAWGISPHLIPHRLLHALSGAISLAFKFRGPNFGIGGGPSGVGEALLTAAAMLGGARPPGLWVVMTGFDPEPDTRASPGSAKSRCNALAFALVAARPDWQGLRLRVSGLRDGPSSGGPIDSMTLESVLDLIEEGSRGQPAGTPPHRIANGISLEWVGASASIPLPMSRGASMRNGYCGQVRAGAENES